MKNRTITSPKGFWAAGVACGIKKSGKNDLGLIVCPSSATVAAVFTTNKIESAAVTVCRKHAKNAKIKAVVVNSGNANTCTGEKGLKNAISMCTQTANLLETSPYCVLVASTGIIGHPLPMDKISAGIEAAAGSLKADAAGGQRFAQSIMTTDTKVKQALRTISISGRKVIIAGTVKGSGMIAPNMATTLCFITTDVAIKKKLLAKVLKDTIGESLNKLTVDGHQSTNDTAIVLASGLAGNRIISRRNGNYRKFAAGLLDVCRDLARQMAFDAEGATRIFTVEVEGAASRSDAAQAARAVANYPLFKCAVNGADPNWGRIICAVGSAGVRLNVSKLSCKLGNIMVFRNGQPTKFDTKKASKVVGQREFAITIELGAGKYSDFCCGCDLSKEYVAINADYHT